MALNESTLSMDLSWTGNSFHSRGAAAEKSRSPCLLPCPRHHQCQMLTRSQGRLHACGWCLTSKFARYEGAMPCSTLNVRNNTLRCILSWIGSQWRLLRRVCDATPLWALQIIGAAMLWTLWILSNRVAGTPYKGKILLSSCDVTWAWTSFSAATIASLGLMSMTSRGLPWLSGRYN